MSKVPNVQTWLRDHRNGVGAKVLKEKLALVGPDAVVYDNAFNTGNDSILTVFGPAGIPNNLKDPDQDPKDWFFIGGALSCLGEEWDLHWDGSRFWARKSEAISLDPVGLNKAGEWLSLKDAMDIWESGE